MLPANLQIVVPMAGSGARFSRAGYSLPKPLIDVDGEPMIARILKSLNAQSAPLLICRRSHIEDPSLSFSDAIRRFVPDARIISVDDHKRGPIASIIAAAADIDDVEPVLVSYCDCLSIMDSARFAEMIVAGDHDAIVPAYRGFHPHLRRAMFHAYIREADGRLLDIQEKEPFTDDPVNEFASSGLYFFRTGALLKEYAEKLMQSDDDVNGEYYVSLLSRQMVKDGLDVRVFEIEQFMNWGTPEDFGDYMIWHRLFGDLSSGTMRVPKQQGAVVIPMAGAGSRFASQGYSLPKPLIPVSGEAMAVQAAMSLPESDRLVFVTRQTLPFAEQLKTKLCSTFSNAQIVELEEETDGQARTCVFALSATDDDMPLTIAACDAAMLYDGDQLSSMLESEGPDVIVWTYRGHMDAALKPSSYSWVREDSGRVVEVTVKRSLGAPDTDPMVIGCFTFRKSSMFGQAAERLFDRGARTNGEFYVDELINDAIAIGYDVRLFDIDHYLAWGTPEELETFMYWQRCFDGWAQHPYIRQNDPMEVVNRR